MRSKNSLFDAALFKRIWLRFWPLFAIYTYALIQVLPATLISRLNSLGSYADKDNVLSIFRNLSFQGVLLLLMAACFVYALCFFSQLFNFRSASFWGALPISRGKLFFTSWSCGIISLSVPMLVCDLICLFGAMPYGGIDTDVFLSILFAQLAMILLFFSMACLSAVISGQVFPFIAFYVLFNFLPAFMEFTIAYFGELLIYGYFNPGSGSLYTICPAITFMNMANYSFTGGNAPWLITGIYFAAGVVFAAAAGWLFIKRRSEAAGDAVAFKWLRPIFKYGFAFCFALLSSMIILTLFFPDSMHNELTCLTLLLLTGFIGFFAAEMMIKKTSRVFNRSGMKGFSVFACAAILLCAVLGFDLLGIEKAVPSAGDVDFVLVTTARNRISGTLSSYDISPERYDDVPNLFSSTEDIEAAALIHQMIIDGRAKTSPYYSDHYAEHIFFSYRLKNGFTLNRTYTVYIPTDDDSADNPGTLLANLLNSPRNVKANIFGTSDPQDIIASDVSVHLSDGEDSFFYVHDSVKPQYTELLAKAVMEDLENGRLFVYRVQDGANIYLSFKSEPAPTNHYGYDKDTGRYSAHVTINELAEATLAALREMGYENIHFFTDEYYYKYNTVPAAVGISPVTN